MTDEKRLAEARIAALYSSSNGNVQFLLQELSARDAEIERLRAELQELEDKYEALLFSRPD